jgi:muramoyltetrapeptide carboxypeptidase
MKLIAPEFLKKGDKVALIAPASFVVEESIVQAERLLTSWGLVPVRGAHVLHKSGSFAGTDQARLSDLQTAFDDKSIKAVWAIRGGYGLLRIIADIDFTVFNKHPKWVVGFSDMTAVHNLLHNKGFMSIHALMPIQLHAEIPATEAAIISLKNALFGKNLKHVLPGCTMGKTGSISGELVGGNLSLLESLTGTKYQLKTKGKILFIEEVGEPLYKIDRMIQSLKLAGCFKGLKGLIVGGFTSIQETEVSFKKTYHNIISEAVSEYSFPVLFDVLAGHQPDNRALVFGKEVIINIGEFISCIRFDLEGK